MISIELISMGESHLEETLESISNQECKNYELICADSSRNRKVKDLLSTHNCKVIELSPGTRALTARFEAHKQAIGEKVLLLDSTRPLTSDALKVLENEYYTYDMVVIKGSSLGEGFWVTQAELLRTINESQTDRLKDEVLAFLLPRYFSSKVLTEAFRRILVNTGTFFNDISYGEHHLIFDESSRISKNIGVTKERLIYHFEDNSLGHILKKYYWYGTSQQTLDHLSNSNTKQIDSHFRKDVGIGIMLKALPINLARSIPFFLGYYFGKLH